jgi:hypothetical protein
MYNGRDAARSDGSARRAASLRDFPRVCASARRCARVEALTPAVCDWGRGGGLVAEEGRGGGFGPTPDSEESEEAIFRSTNRRAGRLGSEGDMGPLGMESVRVAAPVTEVVFVTQGGGRKYPRGRPAGWAGFPGTSSRASRRCAPGPSAPESPCAPLRKGASLGPVLLARREWTASSRASSGRSAATPSRI